MATQTNTHPIMAAQYIHSFEGFPGVCDELINGRIVMTPQPKPLHQHIRKNIERLLDPACAEANYTANGDSNIELTPFDMPAPDVFVVSVPAWKRAMRDGEYLKVKPLLAVEILSPDQDISEKLAIYLTARLDAIWVVDPNHRTVMVLGQLENRTCQPCDEITLPYPLAGSVRVSDFFAGVPNNPQTALQERA
jgi:Uma2 family endonuclease